VSRGAEPTSPVALGDLQAYVRRCNEINRSGAWARVVYKPDEQMTRGDSTTVTAVVTVDYRLPPEEVLPGPGSAASPSKYLVSCVVKAQLSGSSWDFNINNTGWIAESFYTTDTVSWSWFVGPKLGGTHTLILRVRPLVETSAAVSPASTAANSDVVPFTIAAHVHVPWTQVPAEVMSSLAANFKIAQGLVDSISGLIVALGALATALRIKKWRARHRAPAAPEPKKQSAAHV
jgi:hypothetical protein